VYVFDIEDARQIYKLTAEQARHGDVFGASVGLSGSFAVVGAPFTDLPRAEDAGAVYVFDPRTGEQLYRLTPERASKFESFGESVDVCGDRALVGAAMMGEDGGAGAAYVYNLRTRELVVKLTPAGGRDGDTFGRKVALTDRLALVAAPATDWQDKENAGAVYAFDPARARYAML
jgi:hypothetical protein